MTHRGNVSLALVVAGLAACSTQSEDPWVGSYAGSSTATAVDCTTGADAGTNTQNTTTTIMRDSSDGLFIAGAHCLIHLDAVSDAYATVRVQSCSASLSDGTPIQIMLTGGTLRLTGAHLAIEYETRSTTPAQCVTSNTVIDATRL